MADEGPKQGRVTLDDFLEKMYYDSGTGPLKGRVYSASPSNPLAKKWGYWGRWNTWDNAQWQPHALIFGVPLPEPIFHTIADYMCGTTGLWWEYIKVREGIAFSPMSRVQGDMLGKQSFQRKDAREMMATVQTLKTVILNLESDLEKIREQRNAFQNNSPEQVKGLFVDNYGGPSRSWSALAHQVPIVRSALTWFYRLDEKKPELLGLKKGDRESEGDFQRKWLDAVKADMEKQAEEFVKSEELNPAVANYLKRKVQEYINWRIEYKSFVQRTYESIVNNLNQQRANLQLYMRWATRNIQEAEKMIIPYEEMDAQFGIFAEEFPQFAPMAYTVTEMYYDPEQKWPIVMDRMKPWIPCITIQLLMSYNPELQGNKFVRGFTVITYGVMHEDDKRKLKGKLTLQNNDFATIMKTYGGYNDSDLAEMGIAQTKDERSKDRYKELKAKGSLTAEEKAEISRLAEEIGAEEMEKGKTPAQAKASIVKGLSDWFNPKAGGDAGVYRSAIDWRGKFLAGMTPVLEFFGNDVPKTFDTRLRRASWFSYNSFFRVYRGIKSNMGWMNYE